MPTSARTLLALLVLISALMAGCAASRSPIEGAFNRAVQPNLNAGKVNVLFVFRHEEQMHGFDTIPKLQNAGVADFDNLLGEALREISNIGKYKTHTELPNDVNDPQRREMLVTARAAMDYVIEIDLVEESSFRQQALSATVSTLSLTVIPMPYHWDYTIRARVINRDGKRVATLQRKARLANWVEAFLVFAYPFYPLQGKREEIYSDFLHDVFRQIESERILS